MVPAGWVPPVAGDLDAGREEVTEPLVVAGRGDDAFYVWLQHLRGCELAQEGNPSIRQKALAAVSYAVSVTKSRQPAS